MYYLNIIKSVYKEWNNRKSDSQTFYFSMGENWEEPGNLRWL